MVFSANAVINPGTVVIESFNTAITNRAVFASCRTNSKAVGAQLSTLHYFQQMKKVCLVSLYVPRVKAN